MTAIELGHDLAARLVENEMEVWREKFEAPTADELARYDPPR